MRDWIRWNIICPNIAGCRPASSLRRWARRMPRPLAISDLCRWESVESARLRVWAGYILGTGSMTQDSQPPHTSSSPRNPSQKSSLAKEFAYPAARRTLLLRYLLALVCVLHQLITGITHNDWKMMDAESWDWSI
ncbi:hypothetical protein BV25DRAFT_159175 [Artomyces pyxidatus]|uniref:Uncharacterized protein n=1 Tax=Artomyces pyxidatus TaxID=48021 RepID=A0ACB8TAF1_9AGAM|nr:hypothetical protein BV25DRAFT_159175 [Artomyces pyxidatus]